MTTVVGTPPGVTASGYRVTPPPIPLTGLWSWYDAAADADFTDAGGGKVSEWRDHNKNASRKLTAYGYTYVVARGGLQNGHKFVSVSATDDTSFYAVSGGSVPQSNVSIFTVSRLRDTAVRKGHLGWGNTIFGSGLGNQRYGVLYQYGDGYVLDGGPELVGAWTIMGYTRDTTTATLYRDGVQSATTASVPGGGELWVGADYYQTGYRPNADLAEVIIYDRVVTTTERQQIQTYLKAKWSTP